MINIEELNQSSMAVEQSSMAVEQSNATERVFDNDNKRSVSINNRFMIFQDKGKKTQISLFLVKIYESLMKEDNSDIWCWTNSGTSIQIKSISALESTILPKLFKHCKFTSFQRQLHSYDFKKIFHKGDVCLFRNPYFVKGRFANLKNIKRKSPGFTNILSTNQGFHTEFDSVKRIWHKLVSQLDFASCINIFKLLNIPGTDNFSRSYEFLKEADFIQTFLSSNVDLEDCIIRKNYELIMCLMIFHQHENMKTIVNEEQTELVKGLTELYLKNMKNFL